MTVTQAIKILRANKVPDDYPRLWSGQLIVQYVDRTRHRQNLIQLTEEQNAELLTASRTMKESIAQSRAYFESTHRSVSTNK
jgi:hypothetical protein